MLHIYFGQLRERTPNRFIPGYFSERMEDSWFEDERIKKFLLSFQNTEYLGNKTFKSDWFVATPAINIATGVQCAILLCKFQNENKRFYPDMSAMGDDCYSIIVEFAKEKDIFVTSMLDYLDFNGLEFKFVCDNDGKEYYGQSDIFDLSCKYLEDYLYDIDYEQEGLYE